MFMRALVRIIIYRQYQSKTMMATALHIIIIEPKFIDNLGADIYFTHIFHEEFFMY